MLLHEENFRLQTFDSKTTCSLDINVSIDQIRLNLLYALWLGSKQLFVFNMLIPSKG